MPGPAFVPAPLLPAASVGEALMTLAMAEGLTGWGIV